jgi:hypothetical protein
VLAKQLLPALQVGTEFCHQSASSLEARDTGAAGAGVTYDLNARLHLLAYVSGGLKNATPKHQYSWYAAVLFTF